MDRWCIPVPLLHHGSAIRSRGYVKRKMGCTGLTAQLILGRLLLALANLNGLGIAGTTTRGPERIDGLLEGGRLDVLVLFAERVAHDGHGRMLPCVDGRSGWRAMG